MTYIDAVFYHQLFDIAEAQVEPEIHPNNTFDDVWREAVPCIN